MTAKQDVGALIERLRDKTRLRKTHGLTGWVLAEEALTGEAAALLREQADALASSQAEAGRLKVLVKRAALLLSEAAALKEPPV